MTASNEQQPASNELDQALQAMREDMNDAKRQSNFYDIFLNTTFCVPTLDPKELDGDITLEDGQVLPLIMEADGNDYLMIFDSEERLKNWTDTAPKWIGVPGHVIATTTLPPLHIAMNVGSEYSKQFLPDEITWLREVVERCNAEAGEQQQGG